MFLGSAGAHAIIFGEEIKLFNKILIANRGEIACRIAKTCKGLGIQTVAVYSDADQDALHVKVCDEARYIGKSEPKESYLQGQRMIEQAIAAGAQAIHPGYGFLSENASFAKACHNAGLIFIGPPLEAIESMGSKSAAKTLLKSAGVPLVPGYHGENQDLAFLHQQADEIGYPVLLKASAGGGGKGMRIVEKSADFMDAIASCKREAMNSFQDDKILIEKYLSRSRHIEVQVFSDQHDHHIYLFDRDCSVQRRHQKVIEEAPAPRVSPEIRLQMGQAAVNAAKAVNYTGAGTVEFIVEADESGQAGRFYFMEMNTRLQVEHPVTEMVTGLDLVEWQLRVAAGERLPLLQHELQLHGHAVEARIYAESPFHQFLPSIGTLHVLNLPPVLEKSLRIDAGVQAGDLISPFYDPMIAKLIVWGRDRSAAVAKMSAALAQVNIVGVASNVSFLTRLMNCESFSQARLDTALISKNKNHLLHQSPKINFSTLALLVAKQLIIEKKQLQLFAKEPNSPWHAMDGWRMNTANVRSFTFLLSDTQEPFTLVLDYEKKVLQWGEVSHAFAFSYEHDAIRIILGGIQAHAKVIQIPSKANTLNLFQGGELEEWLYRDPLAIRNQEKDRSGNLFAPMPGKVLSVTCQVGHFVKEGDPLMILEAMKMEFTISAPFAGAIAQIHFLEGQQVIEGCELISFVQELSKES